jgi:hypothetical protein
LGSRGDGHDVVCRYRRGSRIKAAGRIDRPAARAADGPIHKRAAGVEHRGRALRGAEYRDIRPSPFGSYTRSRDGGRYSRRTRPAGT